MAASRRDKIGRAFEQQALRHLEQSGLTLVTRNFRTRFGEIDLVMLDRDCLVFVEVRYRRQNRYTTAAASVDTHKQRRLALSAMAFTRRRPRWANHPMRFDVVGFDDGRAAPAELTWLRDAFRPDL